MFDPDTGQLTSVTAGSLGAVQSHAYTYDLLGKLLTRSDANTYLSESFTYDTLNRLTSSTVSLSPTPLVATFTYNATGNLTSKSDVGTYSYPAPGQPRPHGVTSISGGVINTTFTYDAKGNMTQGNGLTVTYTPSNKAKTITRGTTSISFGHDPEHQRFSQTSASGVTLYIAGAGVLAERFAGAGGGVQWTNYLIVAGRAVGMFIEKSDETTTLRYFHTDHLGSISVITDEAGAVIERLSYGELTGNFSGVLNPAQGGHGPLAAGSEAHLFNIAGHALVGCASSVARGSNCGSGALAGGIGPLVSPALLGQSSQFRLVANSVLGGLASVAGGGSFANGATTAAFGYLFNEVGLACRGVGFGQNPILHCGLFVFDRAGDGLTLSSAEIRAQFSLGGGQTEFNNDWSTWFKDRVAFYEGNVTTIAPVDVTGGF